MKNLNFCIKIGVPNRSQLKSWGDYYLAKSLADELMEQGHNCKVQILPEWDLPDDNDDDVVIHFRGLSSYSVKKHHFNIMWNISHPDNITREEYERYDLILVSSEMYAEKLRKSLDVPVEVFLQFTDTKVFFNRFNIKLQNELLFVGNSRGVFRDIVRDAMESNINLGIIGDGWRRFVPSRHIISKWWPNENLNELYSSANILLNDHWEDMRRYGFINNRFFDAAVCKAVTINDNHPEIKKLFPDALVYENKDQLKELIMDIRINVNKYRENSESLYEEVLNKHTVVHRVQELLSLLNKYKIENNNKTRFILNNEIPNTDRASIKDQVKRFILRRTGYGGIYKTVRSIYLQGINAKKRAIRIKKRIQNKLVNPNISLLLNVSQESEIKAYAQNIAKPLVIDTISPLISIIIPTKDGKEYLEDLLPSLKKNTLYSNIEVIIVDNGSKDFTKRYVDEWRKILNIKHFNTSQDLNFSQSVNFGASKALGQYLLLLNNDTVPLYGWLDEMLDLILNQKNVGVVGARLIYNQLFSSRANIKEVVYPGCSIQHDGIKFNWTKTGIIPYNIGKYQSPLFGDSKKEAVSVPAVTAACLLTDKKLFDSLGGFDENYKFGREDVDYCLKVKKQGKEILVSRKSLLFHREFSSQIKQKKTVIKKSRIYNHEYFNEIWNEWLSSVIWEEKLNSVNRYWSDEPLHITFLVTENDMSTTAGDYFSARGLGEALNQLFDYKVSYLARRPSNEWEDIPRSTDVLISMLHDCDIRTLNISDGTIIIAWIRGFLEEWRRAEWLRDFDGIITSSKYANNYIANDVGESQLWGIVPLAANTNLFKAEHKDIVRDIDVCFVGNIFHVEREIVKNLIVDNRSGFHFYGKLETGQKIHPWSDFHRGTVPYSSLPRIYQRSKIVIEDIAPFNIGTINLRIYEAMASGALVIANDVPEILDVFKENVIIYHNKDELNTLLEYYLAHDSEREEIALKGMQFVHTEHSFFKRAKIFKEILLQYLVSPK